MIMNITLNFIEFYLQPSKEAGVCLLSHSNFRPFQTKENGFKEKEEDEGLDS